MRVLVTRPAVSAPRTAEKLRARGYDPVLLPLTEAFHDPCGAIDALRRPYASLAITSAEAARALAPVRVKLADYYEKPFYAVGRATANAAAELGFLNIRVGPGTGLGLAEIVAKEAHATADPLLYLAGRPRSSGFEQHLRDRKLPFDVAEVYEMRAVMHDAATVEAALVCPPPDAVLLYSRQNALQFLDLAMEYLPSMNNLSWLCMSEHVAESLKGIPHEYIRIAPHPDEDGLLALL